MAPGVFLQCLGVVEPHGLLVEDGNKELHGIVVLEPGHVVSGHAKGEGVGLGEHVVAVELLEYLLGHVFRDAQIHRPLPEFFPVESNEVLVVSPDKGPAELVGFHGAEAGHVHGHLVYLVLEQDDPQGALQRSPLQGMVIVPGHALATPLDELGDPVVYPNAGPDRPHLISHVGEVQGFDPGDGLHLGRRLHLEHPDGIAFVHHFINRQVVKIDAAQVDVMPFPLLDELESLLHLGQSAQGQKVDFYEAGLVDAVLVPVAEVAAVDGSLLYRHHVGEGRRADYHAAGVLGQVLGKPVQLARQINEIAPHRSVHLILEFG